MVDRYTKLVLTVIAVLLTVIVFREVAVVQTALGYTGDTVAVTIRGIDECGSCRWEPLPVRVEK